MNQQTTPTTVIKVPVPIRGIFKARQVVEVQGQTFDIDDDAVADIRDRLTARAARRGIQLKSMVRENLVVNSGRFELCRILAGDVNSKIYAVQLGDTKIDGVVSKHLYPADLSDTHLVNEIRQISGAPGGTFQLDSYDFPAKVTKLAPAGLPGTLFAGAISRFVDGGADFIAAGVTDEDVVNLVISGIDYTLPIKRVIGPTELEVENIGSIAAAGVGYTITTPSGQVLFRKFISGNMFPEDLYGPMTIVHEAGLIFTTGTLFNRVVFSPNSPTAGLILQPQDISGVTLGIQVDWLIVI